MSRKISIRFGASSTSRSAMPVMLPPGRAKLFTSPDFHRVAAADEDDRDSIGRHLSSPGGIARFTRHDEVHAEPDQVAGRRRQLGGVSLSEAHPDREVPVLAVTELPQSVAQSDDQGCRSPRFRQRSNPNRARPLGFGRAAVHPEIASTMVNASRWWRRASFRTGHWCRLSQQGIEERAGGRAAPLADPIANATARPSRPRGRSPANRPLRRARRSFRPSRARVGRSGSAPA